MRLVQGKDVQEKRFGKKMATFRLSECRSHHTQVLPRMVKASVASEVREAINVTAQLNVHA